MEKARKASKDSRPEKVSAVSPESAAWKKQVLSERLRTLMGEKNLTVISTAKLMQEKLQGEVFNPVNLSHYRAGRSLPRPRILKALSDVLGVSPEQLVPLPPNDMKRTARARKDHGNAASVNGAAHNAQGPQATALTNAMAASVPAFNIEDLAEGEAWLQINQRLSWPTVIKILEILKGESKNRP